MNKQEIRQKYQQASANTGKILQGLKRKLSAIASLRLLFFIISATSGYAWFKLEQDIYLFPLIIFIIAFFALLRLHSQLKERVEWELNVLEHIKAEEDLFSGIKKGRDSGERFSPAKHTFAYDLDIFGPMSVFVQVNRSYSEGGKRTLANGLLNPSQDSGIIYKLQEAHREGTNEQDWIWRFMALTRISAFNEKEEQELKRWMREEKEDIPVKKLKVLLYLGPIIVLTLVGLWLGNIVTWHFPTLAGICQVFFVGSYLKKIALLHDDLGKKYQKIIPLGKQLGLIEKKDFKSEWLKEKTAFLNKSDEKASAVFAQLARIMARFDSRLNPLGAFIFNFLLLYDLHTVHKLYLWRTRHGNTFAQWLDLLWETEAWASRSSFVFQRQDYAWPVLKEEEFGIEADALFHPLMNSEKAVSNDFSMPEKQQIHLVTGSNMSGKSTFLRALGTNIVLAQNGLPVAAKVMTLCPVFLVSSMRINDSLEDDESYFYAEIKRLEQVTNWIKHKKSPFFLLDEILRGTNSRDKHAGSEALLEKMLEYRANGMMATHDLALAVLEETHPGKLINFCFESQVVDNELYFDYTLRKGVCQNLNAIFLMKKMGIIGVSTI